MPVAIDTSVLVAAEKQGGGLRPLLPVEETAFYIPALAAAEFLVGIHPPVRSNLRDRASQLYQTELRFLVSAFTEADAAQLAALTSELRSKGQQMKFFEAGLAATVLMVASSLLLFEPLWRYRDQGEGGLWPDFAQRPPPLLSCFQLFPRTV